MKSKVTYLYVIGVFIVDSLWFETTDPGYRWDSNSIAQTGKNSYGVRHSA